MTGTADQLKRGGFGHHSFHVMGRIQAVTPSFAVFINEKIKKLKESPGAQISDCRGVVF